MLLPHLSPAAAGVVELVALVLATALLAGSGKTTALAVLVDRVDDPVDAGVAADGLVHRVDADDLVVLVRAVLVDPVAVEHAQVGALAADTLLSGGAEGALVLELVHTHVGRLTCNRPVLAWVSKDIGGLDSSRLTESGTLGHRPLAATTAHTDTVDNVALLGLVSQAAGLVWARRARGAVDHVQLAELELMYSQQMFNEYAQDTGTTPAPTAQSYLPVKTGKRYSG